MLPDESTRIFDATKAIEDEAKHKKVYNHLDAEATTLKGTS